MYQKGDLHRFKTLIGARQHCITLPTARHDQASLNCYLLSVLGNNCLANEKT